MNLRKRLAAVVIVGLSILGIGVTLNGSSANADLGGCYTSVYSDSPWNGHSYCSWGTAPEPNQHRVWIRCSNGSGSVGLKMYGPWKGPGERSTRSCGSTTGYRVYAIGYQFG